MAIETITSGAGVYWSAIVTKLNNMFTEVYGAVISPKVKFTQEGGLAVKLTNKTGAASVKGYLVSAASTANSGVILTPVGTPDCIGVCYEAGVAADAEMWVVVSGIAEVYFWASTVRGHLARVGWDTDTGEAAGQAISEPIPTTPFATDKHFGEIGHVIETRTGAGLAKCVLHFN